MILSCQQYQDCQQQGILREHLLDFTNITRIELQLNVQFIRYKILGTMISKITS